MLVDAADGLHALCLGAVEAQEGCGMEVLVHSGPGMMRRDKAVRRARGAALLFLDGRMVLRAGSLVAALRSKGDAVTGRTVRSDGIVAWAGGVDGAAYGAGLADGAGEVMLRRVAGSATPGLMLLRRHAMTLAGPPGTDDRAFGRRLRAAGLSLVYEPYVVAERMGSAGPGASPAPDPALLFLRDAGPVRRRLLVLDGFVPLMVMGAGYPRARAMLNAIDALGWAVTLYPLDAGDAGWPAIHDSLSATIEVCNRRGIDGLPAFLEERAGFFDAVLVSRPDTMRAVRPILATHAGTLPVVYDAEALFSARAALLRQLEAGGDDPAGDQAELAEELALTEGVVAVLAVTPGEAAVFRAGQAAPVYVVSHPVLPRATTPGFTDRAGFLFVGRLLETGSPNHDGLAWFIRAVWPGIRGALPGSTLTVVGAHQAETPDLVGEGVRLIGPVAEVAPFYDAARVFVAPVRYAAGIPIKVLEAGEAGLPVVATELVATQLGWDQGEALAASDDPAALAGAAVRLHDDEAAWCAMRDAALRRLVVEHGAGVFSDRLGAVLAHVRALVNTG